MAKVFLIGPTVGIELLNIRVFNAVASKLEDMGHTAVIPHELFHEEENGITGIGEREARMRMVDALLECDKAVMIGAIDSDLFAPALLLAARRRIMDVVRVDRIPIELKIENTSA